MNITVQASRRRTYLDDEGEDMYEGETDDSNDEEDDSEDDDDRWASDDYGFPLRGVEREWSEAPADQIDDGGYLAKGSPCGEKQGPMQDLGTLLAHLQLQIEEKSFDGVADGLPPLPGLTIDGLGPIALPIVADAQVEAIKGVAEQQESAPAQSQPIEVEPHKVHFDNHAWEQGLRKLERLIAEQFGTPTMAFTSQLSKLRLFRAGDVISRHTGVKTDPLHVANLTIQLPSICTGGELLIYERSSAQPSKHNFADGKTQARYGCTYAVCNAESQHGVTAVTSGFRLVAEYAILWPAAHAAELPVLGPSLVVKDNAAHLLYQLKSSTRTFFLFFEDHYQPANIAKLGHKALKAKDRTTLSILGEASDLLRENGYSLYLVHAKLSQSFESKSRSFSRGYFYKYGEQKATIDDIYALAGKSLRGLHGDSKFLDEQLVETNAINPKGHSWEKLWAGHRVTTHTDAQYSRRISKTECYHKIGIIAWPRALDDQCRFRLKGAVTSYRQITAKDSVPSPAQVAALLEQWAPTVGERAKLEHWEHESCQQLFALLIHNPSLHGLFEMFLTTFPDCMHFIGNDPDWGLDRRFCSERIGLMNLFELVKIDAVWSRDEIRARMQHALRDQAQHALYVLERSLTGKLEAWRWAIFEQSLVESIANPVKSGIEGWVAKHAQRLWPIAIELCSPALCSVLVSVTSKQAPLELEPLVRQLLEQLEKRPALYASKQGVLEPLLIKIHTAFTTHLQKLPVAPTDWRFPNANVTGWTAFKSFLQGPEEKKIFRLKDTQSDRKLIQEHNRAQSGFSCVFSTITVEGKMHATCKKTTAYRDKAQQDITQARQVLERLVRLLHVQGGTPNTGENAASGRGKGAGNGQKAKGNEGGNSRVAIRKAPQAAPPATPWHTARFQFHLRTQVPRPLQPTAQPAAAAPPQDAVQSGGMVLIPGTQGVYAQMAVPQPAGAEPGYEGHRGSGPGPSGPHQHSHGLAPLPPHQYAHPYDPHSYGAMQPGGHVGEGAAGGMPFDPRMLPPMQGPPPTHPHQYGPAHGFHPAAGPSMSWAQHPHASGPHVGMPMYGPAPGAYAPPPGYPQLLAPAAGSTTATASGGRVRHIDELDDAYGGSGAGSASRATPSDGGGGGGEPKRRRI